MPRRGGDASKLGDRYEALRTAWSMCEILQEQATSIEIEPIDADVHKIEYILTRHAKTEAIQAKRQLTGEGNWIISRLFKHEVIQGFLLRLADPDASCTFVSGHSAHELEEICDRSRSSTDFDSFINALGTHKSKFDEIVNRLREVDSKGNPACPALKDLSDNIVFERLTKIRVETISERSLRNILLSAVDFLVDAPQKDVLDALCDLCYEARKTLFASDIWEFLRSRGMHPRSWNKDARILPALQNGFELYEKRITKLLIGSTLIEKKEVAELISKIEQGNKVLILSGEAGVGKSTSMLSLANSLRERGVLVLPMRLQTSWRLTSTADFGKESLGISASPISLLQNFSSHNGAALLIDQLDSIGIVQSKTNSDLIGSLSNVVDEARAAKNLVIVFACRPFDLKRDSRLRSLFTSSEIDNAVRAKEINDQDLQEILATKAKDASTLTSKQRSLLRNPLNLSLFLNTASTPHPNFDHFLDLCEQFWNTKRQKIDETLTNSAWSEVIDTCAEYSLKTGNREVPEELFDDFAQTVQLMASENVIVLDDAKYSIFHETFYEYCLARSFSKKQQTLTQFIVSSNQDLRIRPFLRAVLEYQRHKYPETYRSSLESILSEDRIRIHLKEFLISWIETSNEPNIDELKTLETFVFNGPLFVRKRINDLFLRNNSWSVALFKSGAFESYFEKPEHFEFMRSLIPTVVSALPESLSFVEAHWSTFEQRHVAHTILANINLSTNSKFFEFFLKLIRSGYFDRDGAILWQIVFDLSRGSTQKVIRCVNEIFERADVLTAQSERNPFTTGLFYEGSIPKIIFKCLRTQETTKFAELSTKYIYRFASTRSKQSEQLEFKRDNIWDRSKHSNTSETEWNFLVESARCLEQLSKTNSKEADDLVDTLMTQKLRVSQFLLLQLFAGNPEKWKDTALKYLISNVELWTVNYFDDARPFHQMIDIIRKVQTLCDEKLLKQLRQAIETLEFSPFDTEKLILLQIIDGNVGPDIKATPIREVQSDMPKPVQAEEGEWTQYILSQIESGVDSRQLSLLVHSRTLKTASLITILERIPSNSKEHLISVDAILEVLLVHQLSAEQIKSTLQTAQQFNADRSIARLIAKHCKQLDSSYFNLLEGFTRTSVEQKLPYSFQDLEAFDEQVESSAQFWALAAIANFVFLNIDLLDSALVLIKNLKQDNLAVTCGILMVLRGINKWDSERSTESFKVLFTALPDIEKIAIAGRGELIWMLAAAVKIDPKFVIEAATEIYNLGNKTEHPEFSARAKRTAGGACIMSALENETYFEALRFFAADENAKLGIADVCCEYIEQYDSHNSFHKTVKMLLNDPSHNVRMQISNCLRYIDIDTQLPQWLLTSIVDSEYFEDYVNILLEVSDNRGDFLPANLLEKLCSILAKRLRAGMYTTFEPSVLARVIMRTHATCTSEEELKILLDCVDLLLELGVPLSQHQSEQDFNSD